VAVPRPVASTTPPEIEEPEPVRGPQRDPDGNDGFCPVHGLAWVLKPGGVSKATNKAYGPFWACASTDKPYCKERPAQAWIEAVG
jgi:hypothetical protein